MTKLLTRRQFGDPILREVQLRLEPAEIRSQKIQQLISDMYYTLEHKKYGVGLAAPQIGEGLAVSVIATKPSPTRPKIKRYKLTIINPEIIKVYGRKKPSWEGCISGTNLYALVPRYTKIKLSYYDQQGRKHQKDFEGLIAQIIQHEVDHLNGILFVDKVKDTTSYKTFSEYKKMRKKEIADSKKKQSK